MSEGARRNPDRHGWNALDKYLQSHDRRLDDLRHDFVLADNLERGFVDAGHYEIRGRAICRHGLFVDVVKVLEVDRRHRARTVSYSYHAGFLGNPGRPVLRYDNAHSYPNHTDAHHKHRFDHVTWQPIEPPMWIGRDDWPHRSDVLEELRDWWNVAGQHLGISVGGDDDQLLWWEGSDDINHERTDVGEQ